MRAATFAITSTPYGVPSSSHVPMRSAALA